MLTELHQQACVMAQNGDLDNEFIFFAVHGEHLYKQPTDVRDYAMSINGVIHHVSRGDYVMHGTVIRMPAISSEANEAVVTEVCTRERVVAIVASSMEDGYSKIVNLV
jgi:hypothetical protein